MVDVFETFIPISMFVVTGVIFWMFFLFRHRARVERQTTIRLALEKGADLSPDFMKNLGEPEPPKNRDLRRGLIWMALAFALALCGFATAFFSVESLYGTLAAAAFPFCIGGAYLIMWRYGSSTEAR